MFSRSGRFFLLFSFLLTSIGLGLAGWPTRAAHPGPNIIFLYIDDMGFGDLSSYGNGVRDKNGNLLTPNIDRVAAQGTRFTQFYVSSPICSPSRVALLTGQHPSRFGIVGHLASRDENASKGMPDFLMKETVTVARLFQQAGYATGQFGKWHMGGGRDVGNAPHPQAYGFDESLVAFEGLGDRVLYKNHGLSTESAALGQGNIEWIDWYEGTDRFVDRTIDFMTRQKAAGKPFYIHLPFNDVHDPYVPAPGRQADFETVTSNPTAQRFYAVLQDMDAEVGRLLDALDRLELANDTLLIIASDNGAPTATLSDMSHPRNADLRGGKLSLYEGGVREPFIVRWPGKVPAGVVNTTSVISTLDMLPTFCALAGIHLPAGPFDGENMSDVLLGAHRSRAVPLFWDYGRQPALDQPTPASNISPPLAIRQGRWKFLRDVDGSRRELYDLSTDPNETTNLADSRPWVAVRLERRLISWYQRVVLAGDVPSKNGPGGVLISDSFDVSGGDSPGSGFPEADGVNYEMAGRFSGSAALPGMRYIQTTTDKPASSFRIVSNALKVADAPGIGAFQLSADGLRAFNFGGFMEGTSYEILLSMNLDDAEATPRRMSFMLTDSAGDSIVSADLGFQLATTGNRRPNQVFKRIDALSNSTGADINSAVVSGLPFGERINIRLLVTDDTDYSGYNSSYQLFVNGNMVDSGPFRFNVPGRFLIFDVAPGSGPAQYDDFNVSVSERICSRPTPVISEMQLGGNGAGARLYWSSPPGRAYLVECSPTGKLWTPCKDPDGNDLVVRPDSGTAFWSFVPLAPELKHAGFFRLVCQPQRW